MSESNLTNIHFEADYSIVRQLIIEGYTQIKRVDTGRYVARVTNAAQFKSKLKSLKDEKNTDTSGAS